MHHEKNDTETHVSKTEARAGTLTKTNRNALIGGLLLVVVALVVTVSFGFLETDRTGADQVDGVNSTANSAAK